MSKTNDIDRREFASQIIKAGVGSALVGAGALWGSQSRPEPPQRLVFGKPLLGTSDFAYRGMWRLSPNSRATGENLSFSQGPIAFRRVENELRLLVVGRLPSGTQLNPHPGPLMEFRFPDTFGETPESAPDLIKVREWGGSWCSGFYYDTNGVRIGGIWYDQDWDVLWYTYYAQFAGPSDPPFLGASRLNDDGTVTKYGPWKHPNGAQYYRTSSWWIYEAPQSVRDANSNAEMCLGAAVGSTAAQGNWGPGLYWYKRPALGTSGTISAADWGPLMGYSSLFGSHPDYFCKRPADYHCIYDAHGYVRPRNGIGYWVASLDQMSGHVWIEGSKWGIATFGRMVRPDRWIWYPEEHATRGGNPHTYKGVTYYDCGGNDGNSYKAGVIWPSGDLEPGFQPAMLLFDPAHPLEVLKGSGRKPYDVQYYARADWHSLWKLPICLGTPTPHGIARYPLPGNYQVMDSPQGQPSASAYDRGTQRLLWCLPRTYNPGFSRYPTIQVWDISA